MLYFLELTTQKQDVFVWVYFPGKKERLLKCIKSKHGFGENQTLNANEHKLLIFYINNPNKIIKKSDMEEYIDLNNIDTDRISEYRFNIKNKFLESSCSNNFKLENHEADHDIFKKGLTNNDPKTVFDFKVSEVSKESMCKCCKFHIDNFINYNKHNSTLYEAHTYFDNLRDLEQNSNYSSLIDYISEKYPNDAKHLYRIDSNTILPFFDLKHKVNFPFGIDTKKSVVENNCINVQDGYTYSLLAQRKFFNATLYNGYTYRLLSHNQTTGETKLGLCRYFDTLDSADYLSSRLKVYHQQYKKDKQENKNLLYLIQEWQKRTQGVIKGDFSCYNSGFGFSLPIFKKLDKGGLELRFAKSSSKKAIWASKIQICPSGTLEHWGLQPKELTFENFKSIIIKELFEESLLGNKYINQKILNQFPDLQHTLSPLTNINGLSNAPASFGSIMSSCESIIELWDEIWNKIGEKKPSLEPLRQIKGKKDFSNLFMVVDAFNHRPEIVFPLYIESKHELNNMFNWEYNNLESGTVSWNNMQDLNKWVKDNYQDWSIPSLAATYLSAKQYFEKETK